MIARILLPNLGDLEDLSPVSALQPFAGNTRRPAGSRTMKNPHHNPQMKTTEHKKIVILADMGKLRAFRLSPPGTALSPHARPEAIEEIDLPARQRDTDNPGRFQQGRSVQETAGMGPGEDHNKASEFEKGRIELLAREITALLDSEDPMPWCLATPASINKRILDLIPSRLRESLATNVTADLTHLPLAEIEHRFLNPSRNP